MAANATTNPSQLLPLGKSLAWGAGGLLQFRAGGRGGPGRPAFGVAGKTDRFTCGRRGSHLVKDALGLLCELAS